MRWCCVLIVLMSGGCADVGAQLRLAEQARKGVALVTAAQEGWKESIAKLEVLRRQRLDEGFDADVREQGALSAEWVIEHRKAYAIGLDAVTTEAAALRRTWEVNASNLKAIDAALARMQSLAEARAKWLGVREEGRGLKGGDDERR